VLSLSKKVDVGGVLTAGRPLVLDATVAIPSFGSYAFPEPARVTLDVQRLGSGVEIEGTVDALWTGACDRCLVDVSRPLHIDVEERFGVANAGETPFGENNVLEGQLLDVADLVRQLVDTTLPIALLCTDDCPGLCATCGNPRRDGACTCPQNG
jgi:uncharacterized metal-binding protein YceD (DUF177 family)